VIVSVPEASPFVGLMAPWASVMLAWRSFVLKTLAWFPLRAEIWRVNVPPSGRLFVARRAGGGLTQS
jgi:hypothetical protein